MEMLCIDFINSRWYITHELFADQLKNTGWLMELAGKWDIASLPVPSERQVEELIEMRGIFAVLLEKTAGGGNLTEADIKHVNSYMAGAGFSRRLVEENDLCRLSLIPEKRNWNWFMAEVAASFSELYTKELADRLRMCGNPQCGWFFIDESKSKNKKWCDDTCASLMKVRRFRQRQKGELKE